MRVRGGKMINWNSTKEDDEVIDKIAKRVNAMAVKAGQEYDVMDAFMDVSATHLNGCPLKLAKLLEADDFNFAHDVFGILAHIDRTNGQLLHCFVPRFAQ